MDKVLRYVSGIVLLSIFICYGANAGSTTCQDIDHNACVTMAAQNPKMCDNAALARSACPQFCAKCPFECYNCIATTNNISQCNTITCGQGEKCLIRAKDTSTGERHYNMMCGPSIICSDFRKRHSADAHILQERNVYSVCCDHDLCNTPSLIDPTTTATPTTIPTTTTTTTTVATTTSTTTPEPTTVTTTTKATTTTHRATKPPGCRKDVVLMIEDSIHMVLFFGHIKNQVKALVNQFDIDSGNTRVALGFFFGYEAMAVWDLNRYTTKSELNNAIDQLGPQHPFAFQAFNIYAAKYANNHFVSGNRPGVPDVLMILSQAKQMLLDAHPNVMTRLTYEHIISRMRHKFQDVVTIAAGNAAIGEMKRLATDSRHYFYLLPPVLGVGSAEVQNVTQSAARIVCPV